MLLFFLQLFLPQLFLLRRKKKSVFYTDCAYYTIYEDYEFFAFRL